MGVYGKATKSRRFIKKRPKKGPRVRSGMATKRDLFMLSKQISNTREHKEIFQTGIFDFGSYNAENFGGLSQTYKVLSLAIDNADGVSCPLGTSSSNRVGNEIRVKRVTLKMNFVPLPYDATTNPVPSPQIVKVYFGYHKPQIAQSRNRLTAGAVDFFTFGATAVNPSGQITDLNRETNKELYSIVKKSRNFKIGTSQTFNAGTDHSYWGNNDFKSFKQYDVDITKHVNMVQRFNESDPASSNRGLFAYVTCVAADGSLYTHQPVQCTYELCYKYTDS